MFRRGLQLIYLLGPGDKLTVNLYGTNTKKITSFISREGNFFIPSLGPINLLGQTFGNATELIKDRVQNELLGSQACEPSNSFWTLSFISSVALPKVCPKRFIGPSEGMKKFPSREMNEVIFLVFVP